MPVNKNMMHKIQQRYKDNTPIFAIPTKCQPLTVTVFHTHEHRRIINIV